MSKDLRNKIKNKKHAWNRFLKTKNPASLLEYKKLSNSIRHQTRLIKISEQTDIAHQCRSNPKKFWNYVNSKFKSKNKISDLSLTSSTGTKDTTNNDSTKAEVLNNFFTSVFVTEDDSHFTKLNSITNLSQWMH
mgnify:CR=1 FL=1